MQSRPRQQLTDDHAKLETLLKQLQAALASGDVKESYATLDLFWARLAVHIRAEHLHLFSEVMIRVREKVDQAASPSVRDAQLTIEQLRTDHDFFMHELAAAVAVLRDLGVHEDVQPRLAKLSASIVQLQKRLDVHNEIEENRIYRWASDLFDEREQVELAARINHELRNRPRRFDLERWEKEP